jgi:hypothetical protein
MLRRKIDSLPELRLPLSRVGAAFITMGIGGLLIAALPAEAQETDLGKCLVISDVNARVQCYDELARSQQSRAGSNKSDRTGSSQPSSSASKESGRPAADAVRTSTPRAEFGLSEAEREKRLPSADRQLDSITTTVRSAQLVGVGYWQYRMQDGSIWRMTESPRLFRPPEPGDAVQIRRGALGSYYLDADRQPGVRIKRVG